MHRAPDGTWAAFVADFEPQQAGEHWRNRVRGVLPANEVRDWTRLHQGLTSLMAAVDLVELSHFQQWVPVIRRFSYVLAPSV
ncbi:MAG TPA: hypothetical protein VFG87_08135 [Amycolatopsis sp.]|nr:hypothetical protein [Amycolatopsis sp.]